jgi:arsenate reductase
MRKPLIYFLCTHNSCRSQMAEGFARHLAGDRWEVASAGTEPSVVHPLAVAVMEEAGVDISRQVSKPLDPGLLERAAVIVTLCGDAEERCPVTPAHVHRVHWPLPDPAKATGSASEVRAAFRAVRDDIGERVKALLV